MMRYLLELIKTVFQQKSKYKSLNYITINKNNLIHNFHVFQNYKPHYTIIPVLKSNAYGHGIKQVTGIVNQITECKLIAIDSYPEYQIIHKYTDKQILIMGETRIENYALFDYKRTQVAVWSLDVLKVLGVLDKKINIHIFVNTGMNREGVQLQDLEGLLLYIKQNPHIKVVGVMSHLACADEVNHRLNQLQSDFFYKALSIVRSHGFNPEYIHIEASAGMINSIDKKGLCTTGRLGIGLYGIDPNYNSKITDFGRKLRPCIDVYSTVTAVQKLSTEESVGYSATRQANNHCYIGAFPFGYKEGTNRELSGRGLMVGVGEQLCELVGRVSMNYSTLESEKELMLGSKVHLLSSNISDPNNIYNFFDKSGKIAYEICRFDDKIKRVVV